MMKKQLLLSLCLSASLLYGAGWTATASAMAASTRGFAIASDDEGSDNNNTSTNTYGTDDNTATLTKSTDGKTLTITGKGDLTQIDAAYKFSATLPQNTIFTKSGDDDNATYTAVSQEAEYSSSTTYYTRAAIYNKVDNFTDTYTEKKTHYYFTAAGAKTYYTRTQTSWDENPTYNYTTVTKGDEVNKTEWVDGSQKTGYFTKSTDNDDKETYTRVDNLTDITNKTTGDDAVCESKEVSHLKDVQKDEIFYSSDGTNYSPATDGAVYVENTTYYKRTWQYSATTSDALFAKFYISNETSFVKGLWTAVSGVEKVEFKNEDTNNPLLIDNDILWAIVYPTSGYSTAANATLKTLDLGAATTKGTPCLVYQGNTNYSYYWGLLKLEEVTLPLAQKAEDGSMTLSDGFFHYDNSGTRMALGTTRNETIDGNYTTLGMPAKITVPAGYTALGEGALKSLTGVTEIVLPDGLKTIDNEAISGCTNLTTVNLPTSLETIGNRGFWSCSNLADVTFPASLKSIGISAFANCLKLSHINLNEGLETIGNSAFYLSSKNSDQQVLEIPSTVKYIGPGAFNFRWYADVYYYGDTAPISPYGLVAENSSQMNEAAFGSQLLCGNNGFNPTAKKTDGTTAGDIANGYASRENYINGGEYIAVLHFKPTLTDEQAETFTDITRKYEHWLKDGQWNASDKKTVGKETEAPTFGGFGPGIVAEVNPGYEDIDLGSQFTWPSQSQFIRSFCVNSNGLKWDGVTKYEPSLTEDQLSLIKTMEKDVTGSDLANATDADLKKVAYLGTRQFVLVSRDVQGKKDEYEVPVEKGGRWWTLCVPCDVTRAEVDKVFGKDTRLCLMSKVVRIEDQKNGNELHLYFQNDTYKNKYTRASDGTWTKGEAVSEDTTVVLYAHTPYMIYPQTTTPTTEGMDKKTKFVLTSFELKAGNVLPTVVTATSSKSETSDQSDSSDNSDNSDQSDNAIKYEFTGNYRSQITVTETGNDGNETTTTSTVKVPQYTYVFGRTSKSDDSGKSSKFFIYTGTQGEWKANKCVVERWDAKGENDYNTFFKKDANNGAKQFSIFGEMDDDNSTTAIDRVVYHYGEESSQPVYNISGQLVSADGTTTGLAKGIYIQGGKKFVVK